MHGVNDKDGDRVIDWSKASNDYALHRLGYPDSFYQRLGRYEIGLKGQRVLDLGCGTGLVARRLAAQGCEVVGVDISFGQIEQAKQLAKRDNLSVDFRVGSAEETKFESDSFDIIISSQSWLYFDFEKTLAEVTRLLVSGGLLVTCHLCWLPRIDRVAAETERLIQKHNPDWSAGDWDGVVPIYPRWFDERLKLQGMYYYDQELEFTHESWRGRIRASRGISATLDEEQVNKFDIEHQELLTRVTPERFGVLHRIDAHVFGMATTS